MPESGAEFPGGRSPHDRAGTGCQRERLQQLAMIVSHRGEDDDCIRRFALERIADLAAQFGPCEGTVGLGSNDCSGGSDGFVLWLAPPPTATGFNSARVRRRLEGKIVLWG